MGRRLKRHELGCSSSEKKWTHHGQQQEFACIFRRLHGCIELGIQIFDEQKIGEMVMECQDWFVRNRLYLQPKVAVFSDGRCLSIV